MEGPLSKWTNVMKGWQYRWFVLDDSAGLLSYYTSKDKMVRGTRRGCVRLRNAVVGIDDDDDSTFTITVDAKTFHFQAHDADERETWIRALEDTILRHALAMTKRWDPSRPPPTMADFDKRLTECDGYLQLLIDQKQTLHQHNPVDDEDKRCCNLVQTRFNTLLETVKHSIVLLQIAKNTAFPANGVYQPCNAAPPGNEGSNSSDRNKNYTPAHEYRPRSSPIRGPQDLPISYPGGSEAASLVQPEEDCDSDDPVSFLAEQVHTGIELGREAVGEEEGDLAVTRVLANISVPETSYSSSEDEDFFDADEFNASPSGPRLFDGSSVHQNGGNADIAGTHQPLLANSGSGTTYKAAEHTLTQASSPPPEDADPIISSPPKGVGEAVEDATEEEAPAGGVDYDSLYDEDPEADAVNMEGHGFIIQHLLSQVKIGMDLTKVVLPTFILERRSLLEMYADFFAHPDLFCDISKGPDPKSRIVGVLKWYLSAFHAGRKSEVAKKPYNPIIGEVFKCHWDTTAPAPPTSPPNTSDTSKPLPWVSDDHLSFVAEQVSHHPPVSAFYAENVSKRISFCGHIWTKSKFLGLSVCVYNIGQGCVSLLDHDEEYIVNFPSGYCRSILTVPWVELGGSCQITCSKTGYSANIEFMTKPFYGGKKHRMSAEVFSPGEKKAFMTVDGEWNGVMTAKWVNDGSTEVFVNTHAASTINKNVKPIAEQLPNESRNLWKECTAGLKYNNIHAATEAKCTLEQKQRDEAKQRKEADENWETKLFSLQGENWIYHSPLVNRIKS